MFIKTTKVITEYIRPSKHKKSHAYSRSKTIAVFQCDNCGTIFQRDAGTIDRKRLSDNYYHVCPDCNPKQFAQKIGAKRRLIWNLPADSDIDISQI